MELVNTKEEESEMLRNSGYEALRSKRLNSMSMKEYLTNVEDRISAKCKDDPVKEIELVDQYINLINQEKSVVS